MWKIYILYSETHKKTYVGFTSDIEERLKRHNSGNVESSKRFLPWRVIYTENFTTQSEARKRERYYKTSAGRRKIKLIFASLNINTETCPSG